jgi:hypothetical protein
MRGAELALQVDNEQEEPDPAPSAPQKKPPLFVRLWPIARTGIQLAGTAAATKHEGLHLAAQALAVAGDLTVMVISNRRRNRGS